MAAACTAGFFAGRGIRIAQDGRFDPAAWFAARRVLFAVVLFIIWLVISAAACLTAQIVLGTIRRRIPFAQNAEDTNADDKRTTDAEAPQMIDDDLLDQLEQRMFVPSTITQIMTVVNMLLFPICFFLATHSVKDLIFYILLLFVLNYVWIFATMARCIRLERNLNPEKRGSLLELNFYKQWVNSSDGSGYAAFQAGSAACLVLWVVTFVGMMAFDTGILAIAVVCIIWLAMILAFIIKDIELEK